MNQNGYEPTRLHSINLQQEWVFKQVLIPCLTTQVFQHRTNTFSNHTQSDQRSTPQCFDVVKPLWGNIHSLSEHGHLEQFINAKRKRLQRDFTSEFLTIDHQKMTLHAL
jgi:hypothetical protein